MVCSQFPLPINQRDKDVQELPKRLVAGQDPFKGSISKTPFLWRIFYFDIVFLLFPILRFQEISFLSIEDFFRMSLFVIMLRDLWFSKWHIVNPFHFLQEIEVNRLSFLPLCIQLPKYQQIFHIGSIEVTREIYTIWWQHNQ